MDKDKVHGEGNYKASRDYNEATKKFVNSGKVDDAARKSAPKDAAEAEQMKQAEEKGKRRAKEEDPELYEGGSDTEEEDLGDEDLPGERP
jgi:hypothetical protein